MDITSTTNFTVVINNRNRLSTTKKMVEDLLKRDTNNIIIIDNESTYPPLLEWYKTLPPNVKVHYGHNYGHHAIFVSGVINEIKEEWCFYTDADIELNPNMPNNYQEIMLNTAIKYNCNKVALALKIDDLPEHYWLKEQVKRNEGRWWLEEVEPNVFKADTDTTFCLIKKCDQFDSLRIAGDFTAKHTPWYLDLDNLSVEEDYYNEHLGERALTQYSKQHKLRQEL
jgi:glycosyltransferase involved in cell wall biosynthesis